MSQGTHRCEKCGYCIRLVDGKWKHVSVWAEKECKEPTKKASD